MPTGARSGLRIDLVARDDPSAVLELEREGFGVIRGSLRAAILKIDID
jgi:hypothetical protein